MTRAEFRRVWDSEEFKQYTERSPSVISGWGPCVGHHVRPNPDPPAGAGRKPDAKWVVPVTFCEHQEIHGAGQETFEKKHGVNLADEAKEHWARWQRESEEL